MSNMKKQGAFEFDCEFARQIEEKRTKFKENCVPNDQNMEKLRRVYDFFCHLAESEDGEVKRLDVQPESKSASISIEVAVVDLHRDGMKRFVDVLQYMDTFEVGTTTSDTILISASVNDVWEATE